MANRDWSALGWTPNLSFAPQTDFQLARSSLADAGKGAETKFAPNAQNAALLAALGYTGPGLVDTRQMLGIAPDQEFYGDGQSWSPEALQWLNSNGYNVGVAHDPGTSPGGRPEYYGLVNPGGQFVQGQADPTQINSDTLMDQIGMFATFLGPVIGGISAAGGIGAGGGMAGIGADGVSLGSGAAAGGSSGIGSLGAAADGLTALGPSWSPEALGLTNLAPAVDYSSLLAEIGSVPGIVEVGGGVGAGLGSVAGNADKAALFGESGWGPGMSGAETAAYDSALAGGSGGAAVGGGLSSAEKGALYGADAWGPGMSGAQTSAYDSILNLTGSKGIADLVANSTLGSSLINGGKSVIDALTPATSAAGEAASTVGGLIKPISDAVGGGGNLAALVGAGLGAASGGGSTTSSRDPWSAAQPLLKNILGDAETMRAGLAAQPYTPQQTSAYNNAFAGLDQARSALPGLLNWGQGAMQRQSTTPSWASLFGGQQPGAQPTAQAGGAGGLLGDSQQDRMKALMARGRGLIG